MHGISTDALRRSVARDLVANSGGRLSLTEAEREGSDLYAIVETIVQASAQAMYGTHVGEARLFLDTANKYNGDLDRYGFDRYGGLQRNAATPASGTVAIWCTPARTEDTVVAAETVILSTEGTRYYTRRAVTIPAGSTADVLVTIQSMVAGAGQGAGEGAISAFESAPAGDLRVSNDSTTHAGATAIAGAADKESAEAYSSRIRRYWSTQQRGTLDALEVGALTVDGVAQATAIEIIGDDGTAGGVAYLYVCDDAGNSSSAMVSAVEDVMPDWRAAGIAVVVSGGSPQHVSVVLDLTLEAGFDLDSVRDRIEDALTSLGRSMAPGETLYYGDLVAAVQGVPGVVASQSAISSPVGDVVPSNSENVLRIDVSDISYL